MDLSAIIFVVLALAWAVYLLPKALKHHDEMASDRLVEGHSDKVRILSRKRTVVTETVETLEPADVVAADVDGTLAPEGRRVTARPTRAAARKAAQRRRRVLGVLVLVLAVVWTLTWFAYLPIWAPAIPGALAAAWLVVSRLSVRRQQRRRVASAVAPSVVESAPSRTSEPAPSVDTSHSMVERLTDEDLTGAPREEVEAVLADDGSLWDPLPMTLPTYVNKARARRTVRTIELTGINSSGHDEADTALARDAAESTEQSAPATAAAEDEQRRVAGA